MSRLRVPLPGGGVRGGGKKGGGWGRLNTVKRGEKRSCRPKNEGARSFTPLYTAFWLDVKTKEQPL